MFNRVNTKLVTGIIAGFVFLSMMLSGCGDDDQPPTKSSGDLISKDTGGTATLQGRVTVTVPPEAISVDAFVQIGQTDSVPALPDGYGFTSPAYDISLSAGQITDTIWIAITYQDALLPEGQLETALLIGRVEGQVWVFEDPEIRSGSNSAIIGTLSQTNWAVVWKTQNPRETVGAIIDGVINEVDQERRADIELALGAGDVEDLLAVFQEYKEHYENSPAGEPAVESAVMNFLATLRAIENDDKVIMSRTATELTGSFLALGRAIGYDIEAGATTPPRVQIGSRRWLPPAFAGLFAGPLGYSIDGATGTAGQLQSTRDIQHDFFVQLNYDPTFGGLTYLDFPEGYEREVLNLANEVTGIYFMELTRVSTQSNLKVRFDYLRDRGIVLHWPVEEEVLFFNLPDVNESVNSLAVVVEFGNVLADFHVVHANPFSSSAHSDSLGSWLYFGLPATALTDLRKQDGRVHFILESGGSIEYNTFPLPVSRRPLLSYGDWVEPAAVTDLAIEKYWGNSIRLGWTATGNDLDSGTATWYDLRFHTSPLTEENWEDAVPVVGEPLPRSVGSAEEFIILPYDLLRTTYLGLKVFDQDYNISPLSNVIQLSSLSELVVEVPDYHLEETFRAVVGRPEGPIYGSDLAGITDFSAQARGVITLDGMEYLPNLVSLDLRSNGQLMDLSPLRHLINLQELLLGTNYIRDISDLVLMKQLRVLDLSSNTFFKDLSPLAGLTQLESLNLRYDKVNDARPLIDLRSLKFLDLGNNDIQNLEGLQYLRGIRTLRLNDNRLLDIKLLMENPGLDAGDTLDIRGNTYVLYEWETRNVDIPALEERGVVVLHDGQN